MEEKKMKINPKIQTVTEELFGINYSDESVFTDEKCEELADKADELREEFSWKEIYKCWFNYLKDRCNTPEEVINWAHLYWTYVGSEEIVEEPYRLGGLLLYRISDKKKYYDDLTGIIDSVVTTLLENSGYISLVDDPYYDFESDPKILAELEKWKKYYSKKK